MKRLPILAAAALASLGAAPINAQMAAPPAPATPSPDSPELRAAKQESAKRMITVMRKTWSDPEIGRILYIGWYSAAATICDDLEVDQAKLGKALAGVLGPDIAKASADKAQHLASMLSLHVGMATGYVMASHVQDGDRVCAQGREAMKDMPADKHLFRVSKAQ
ncbi:MAG: hypothetical protein B7Y82_03750 [Sphingomonadales bacterium 32-65-25]|nr:MAG: hypothetical protein B7Y82_03750 [Sphingomonadales bacterium 32-65-25]